MKNVTAPPEFQDPTTDRVCAVPRSEYAESESFLSKMLRVISRENNRPPEWEELLLQELIGRSARYGWNAWETEENARKYEEAFYAYLQNTGCPEEDLGGNAWTLFEGSPDVQAEIKEFQRMAAFYEPADVNFLRPGLDAQDVIQESSINEKCRGLLGENVKLGEHYSGCTRQGGVDLASLDPYSRSRSQTFYSSAWKGEELENVKSHELAHQFIITLGQLMEKEVKRREILGLPTLDLDYYHSELKCLEEILDEQEKFEPGKLRLRRRVDVLRKLKWLHCQFLKDLYKLEAT